MFGRNDYVETQVMTASAPQLHLMVIDGAIRYAKRAELALEAGDFERSHFALNSSRDFLAELIAGLDPTHAPEIVEPLKSVFLFAQKNLVHADLRHDPQLIRNALRVLELHRETWMQVIGNLRTEIAEDSADASESSWMR